MLDLRVTHIAAATPRVRMVELVAADGGSLPPFTAGAHIDLELGNGETRSYSLLNNPSETHRYVLGVLRELAGQGGSAWVHDQLSEGDRLRSSAPLNMFPLNEEGQRHILIAGGIGVTPIMAMAARLAALGADYTLYYCARGRDDAAFIDDLERRHGERLKPHYDGGEPARGLDVKNLLAKRPAAGHVYVCGPAGLIRAAREAGKDWPNGTVHYELFNGDEADIAPRSTDQAFDIVLNRSKRTLTVPADKTILAVLKAEGVRVKTLCVAGTCGTCRVGLISGVVDHRDDVLDDDERDSALQVCVSRAMPGETLVLDL